MSYVPQAITSKQGEAVVTAARSSLVMWQARPGVDNGDSSKRVTVRVDKPRRGQTVKSLFSLCVSVLQRNIDYIGDVGDVPVDLFLPVLEHCTPLQLRDIEEFNPHFIPATKGLWKKVR